jgi:hypothetical protein
MKGNTRATVGRLSEKPPTSPLPGKPIRAVVLPVISTTRTQHPRTPPGLDAWTTQGDGVVVIAGGVVVVVVVGGVVVDVDVVVGVVGVVVVGVVVVGVVVGVVGVVDVVDVAVAIDVDVDVAVVVGGIHGHLEVVRLGIPRLGI